VGIKKIHNIISEIIPGIENRLSLRIFNNSNSAIDARRYAKKMKRLPPKITIGKKIAAAIIAVTIRCFI
jgi:hypothetical protein